MGTLYPLYLNTGLLDLDQTWYIGGVCSVLQNDTKVILIHHALLLILIFEILLYGVWTCNIFPCFILITPRFCQIWCNPSNKGYFDTLYPSYLINGSQDLDQTWYLVGPCSVLQDDTKVILIHQALLLILSFEISLYSLYGLWGHLVPTISQQGLDGS